MSVGCGAGLGEPVTLGAADGVTVGVISGLSVIPGVCVGAPLTSGVFVGFCEFAGVFVGAGVCVVWLSSSESSVNAEPASGLTSANLLSFVFYLIKYMLC